jgi:hypothetical protein
MKLTKIAVPAVLFTALTFVSMPAFAQSRHGGGSGRSSESRGESRGDHGGNRGGDRGSDRGGDRGGSAARSYAAPRGRVEGPRYDARRDTPRNNTSYRRDNYAGARAVPRSVYVAPRVVAPYRGYDRGYNRGYNGNYNRGYAVPRSYGYGYASNRYDRGYRNGYGYYGTRYYGPRFVRSYAVRPYAFRPYTSLGFGFYVGYSVPYTWGYPAYAPEWSYGYPGAVGVVPGPSTYGGVSFEVTPNDATVYVDGNFVGATAQFDGSAQPLSLIAGSHRIELRAQGCEPLVFNVDIRPGQVIPYQGDLVPIGQY